MIPNAQIVLPARPFAETLAFFRERLGMRLLTIRPAEQPITALVAGGGVRLLLDATHDGDPGTLRLEAERDEDLLAPNGTRIQRRAIAATSVPRPTGAPTVVGRARRDDWTVGRAGMQYRDLIPGRLGGHLIASHIRIQHGGPVPDDVHFHDISFQLIHCLRGWVRVDYENPGGEVELRAGETLLQPPGIRHRVRMCSDMLEVVEITSPAEHLTTLDHELALPDATLVTHRQWDGQQFLLHRPSLPGAPQPEPEVDFEQATAGRVRVHQLVAGTSGRIVGDPACVDFLFVRRGSGRITIADTSHDLPEHGAATLPPGHTADLHAADGTLEALHVQAVVD
ncbi:MAG: cupin [Planctomycetota bacterium]